MLTPVPCHFLGFLLILEKNIYIHVLASGSSLFPSQSLRIALSCVNKIDIMPATPPRFGEGLLHSHSLLQRPALCLSHAGQRAQTGLPGGCTTHR